MNVLLVSVLLAGQPVEINDSFDAERHPARKALRGHYDVKDGVLSVGHDPELYAKYKDHGPIVTYAASFRDADASLRFRLLDDPEQKAPARGAFTLDGNKGHVLRVFTYTNQPGRAVVWNEGEKKAIPLTKELPTIEFGKWTDLKIAVNGTRATITLAGKSVEVEHPALARQKTNAKYSSAFAKMELDEFSLEAR